MDSPEKALPKEVMDALAEALAVRVGWNRESLPARAFERAVAGRIAACGLATASEYLACATGDARELHALAEGVQESWFFRQRGAFEFLVHFVSGWKRTRPLKVLSVGCAHGEEPYSVVMTLLDAGLDPARFSVDAIDLSRSALDIAERGIYGDGAFRESDVDSRHRYFVKVDGRFHISDTVRSNVRFRCANAVEIGGLENGGPYDVILCRNMLIYLHDGAQEAVVSALEGQLADGGVLIVGPSDGGLLLQRKYRPVRYPGACAFRRFDMRKDRQLKRLALASKAASIRSGASGPAARAPTASEAKLLEEASTLADRGEVEAAEALCRGYLEKEATNAEAHFILGLIEHSKGDELAAYRLFERTLYLDAEHYEALVYLSLLAGQCGDEERAEVFRERAGRVLRKGNGGMLS